MFLFFVPGVAGSVEVHFENKDGGFFLKHTPRQYYPAVADLAGSNAASASANGIASSVSSTSANAASVLSVDRFAVFQTSQPVSIRATYGPFSTKQTVPARYLVPDPVPEIALPLPGRSNFANNGSAAAAAAAAAAASMAQSPTSADAADLDQRHLDVSAHVVAREVARDAPVLRVLFHTGGDPGARRLARHQRVCIVVHASLGDRQPLSAACTPDGEDGVCLAQVTHLLI